MERLWLMGLIGLTVLLLIAGNCSCHHETAPDDPGSPTGANSNQLPQNGGTGADPDRGKEDARMRMELERELERIAAGFPGIPGIGLIIPGRDMKLSHGGEVVFPSASLVKLPILVTLYQRGESGQLDLNSTIILNDRDRREGSGELKYAPAGGRYSLRELGRRMIVDSDNTATDILIRQLGMDAVNQRMQALGLFHTTLERTIFDFEAIDAGRENLTTPNEMAALLSSLAAGKLAGVASTEEMLGVLREQKRNDMIPAGLPPGIAVAHKTGELAGVIHDCGIIYHPRGQVILCLLGKDVSDRDAAVAAWVKATGAIHAVLAEEDKAGASQN